MISAHTVSIVDDDHSFRDSLSLLLRSVGHRVKAYPSAAAFLHEVDFRTRGCFIFDVRMPACSGLELQEQLAKRAYCQPIIFLTGHDEVPAVVRAMRQGATEFLLKTCAEHELLDAVQRAMATDAANRAALERTQSLRTRLAQLTPGERVVFDRVAAGEKNTAIAASLRLSRRTVEVRRANLMAKLDAHNVADLVRIYVELEGDPKPPDKALTQDSAQS